ncbi:DNA-binding protein [Flavobacterium suzhouense]|uniref:DNA-binding protein n=1 Tax=Flavobacterium suzhouense TaxID=1529638 RepID=A0ABW5NV77_9FLAO
MSESITKEDLHEFGTMLLHNLHKAMKNSVAEQKKEDQPEWLKSKTVRKLMDMSPGSIQNLRITGRVRFKKVMGSYYYNRSDLLALFSTNT